MDSALYWAWNTWIWWTFTMANFPHEVFSHHSIFRLMTCTHENDRCKITASVCETCFYILRQLFCKGHFLGIFMIFCDFRLNSTVFTQNWQKPFPFRSSFFRVALLRFVSPTPFFSGQPSIPLSSSYPSNLFSGLQSSPAQRPPLPSRSQTFSSSAKTPFRAPRSGAQVLYMS